MSGTDKAPFGGVTARGQHPVDRQEDPPSSAVTLPKRAEFPDWKDEHYRILLEFREQDVPKLVSGFIRRRVFR